MLQRALFLQSGGNSVCIYLIPNLSRKPCEGSGLRFRLDRKLIHGNFILKESGGIPPFDKYTIRLCSMYLYGVNKNSNALPERTMSQIASDEQYTNMR